MILLDDKHAADFIAHLELFEGRFSHLYLDGPGFVTVGVGCMLSSASASAVLPWIGDISRAAYEWNVVKLATPGLAARAYASMTTLRLPDAEIDRLRDQRIASMEGELIHAIRGVSDFPMDARQAICEMGFNLGVTKLHDQYFGPHSKFGPAVYAGDWQTAAQESARRKIQPARNNYARDLLMSVQANA